MKRVVIFGSLAVIVLVALTLMSLPRFVAGAEEMAFGGKADVEFANKMWKGMKDYQKWVMQSDMLPGKTPHGAFIRYYYNIVNVDRKPYHVVAKDNFMPNKQLAAVTVMVQREAGYDPDNNDWFWVKYKVDGTVGKNPKGMSLAGRVAKGMDAGCIACHKTAKDNDYIFVNDGKM